MMKADELEQVTGTVSALEIQVAIVGAINTYLNQVLEPNGIINEEADENYPDYARTERHRFKYQIATRAAYVALGLAPDFNWRDQK